MSSLVERVIEPRPRDLGDFAVRRVLPAAGLQTAAGVPLQCDEPADFRTFRLGLFGLDKLHHVERTVATLAAALEQVHN